MTMRIEESAVVPGGLDIVLSFSPEQIDALGPDASTFVDWVETALWALAALRDGGVWGSGFEYARPADVKHWHMVVNDLEHRLLPRLAGIRDAAVREHAAHGGSVGDLARAMDVPRSTAQSRREALSAGEPAGWEAWARTEQPAAPQVKPLLDPAEPEPYPDAGPLA